MKCPACRHDNDDDAAFCEECGERLDVRCSTCGTAHKPTTKFCPRCGVPASPVAATTGTTTSAASPHTPPRLASRTLAEEPTQDPAGELKTVTILFADLKGSTALIEGLDPEAARARLDPALRVMMDAVHAYEGFVAQVLGDGILALFGAPIALEDHAQRAVGAALRMQTDLRQHSAEASRTGGAPLQLRVGINTGDVLMRAVVREHDHADYVPVGRTIHLAARVEQLATPGRILLTEHTHRHCAGQFEFTALGDTLVRGIEQPVALYEVVGTAPHRMRFQAGAQRGLSRFSGRGAELQILLQACRAGVGGAGRIVDLVGEPGIGKSRLLHEITSLLPPGTRLMRAQAVSHGRGTPYLPLIPLLQGYFGIATGDDDARRRQKISTTLGGAGDRVTAGIPFLYPLLLEAPDPAELAQYGEQVRRQRALDAVKDLLLAESVRQPVVLVVEDLHWIDSVTEAALALIAESIGGAHAVLITTYRPEYTPPWHTRGDCTTLRLTPLAAADARDLVAELLGTANGTDQLPGMAAVQGFILNKAQGSPFFIEEVVQALLEQGYLVRDERGRAQLAGGAQEPHLDEMRLPATIEGVIAARVDRLPPVEKSSLQQLSVIGRSFPLELAADVLAMAPDTLSALFSELQRREFVHEIPGLDERRFTFKHALTQDVAYREMPRDRRRTIHGRVARAIEDRYATELDQHSATLAHHYQQGGDFEKAVHYLRIAGRQAILRSAAKDAVEFLESALVALANLPQSTLRDRQELETLVTLGAALQPTLGISAERVKQVYGRARELCRELGLVEELFPVVAGLRINAGMRGEPQLGYAREMLELATRLGDPATLLHADMAMGLSRYTLGDFTLARTDLARAIDAYRADIHGEHAVTMGMDAGIAAMSFLSLCLWCLGYPDGARVAAGRAWDAARRTGYPFMASMVGILSADVNCLCGDIHRALEDATNAARIADEFGFPEWTAFARPVAAWARGMQGDADARADIETSLGIFRYVETTFHVPFVFMLKADLEAAAGDERAALTSLDAAVAMATATEQNWILPELYRVRGTLTVATNPTAIEDAAVDFERALDLARAQGAKSWELRAATSLARLRHRAGGTQEGYSLLEPVYAWFAEGFDTRDLRDARALLDEMANGASGISRQRAE